MKKTQRVIASCAAILILIAVPRVNTAVIAQHVGMTDPESEGFARQPFISGVPEFNIGGSPAWRTTGTEACCSFYHKALGATEEDYAAITNQGWRLTSKLRMISGAVPNYAIVGFLPSGPRRYEMQVQNSGANVVIRLFDGDASPLAYTVVGGANRFVQLDLIYQPSTGSASLFVDGIARLSGYQGAPMTGPAYGLVFGGGGVVVDFNVVNFETPATPLVDPTTDYAAWSAQVTEPTTIDFESLPVGTILDGNEYVGQGLFVIQRDGHDIRVVAAGDGSFASAANFQSPTRGLSSSAVPAQPEFPFGYDGSKSENYDFLLIPAREAAGLWVGNLNPGFNTVVVEFLDAADTLIGTRSLTTSDPHLVAGGAGEFDNRMFVGLQSTTPIKRIRVWNAAGDQDGIIFDDVVLGPIANANEEPVAGDSAVVTLEDTSITGVLNANDPDDDPLTFSLVSNGSRGTATITDAQTGAFTYVPNPDANGQDTFTWKANDGTIDSNVGTVSVTITPVDDVPASFDSMFPAIEDTPATFTLQAADKDGDPLTFHLVSSGSKGSVTITNPATGAMTYTPNANANGVDTFSFKVNDGTTDSNLGTVTMNIAPVNDAPEASDGALATTQDLPATGTLVATDVDGPTLGYAIATNGANGVATILNAATGSYRYVPNAGITGGDTFTFVASDGSLTSNVATVTVTIAPKVTPVISWAIPADVTFPAPLGAGQLNATANVGGTFAYSPGAGTVLNAGAAQTLSVIFTPADTAHYTTASKSVLINVAPAVPTTTLVALPASVGYLQPVYLVATVAPVAPATGVPVGVVEMFDGTTSLGTATLSAGVAYLSANGLAAGTHSVTARYLGAGNFTASVSSPATVTVQPPATSTFTLLIPLSNPQAVGQPVVFAALVVRLGAGPAAVGSVQFLDSGVVIGTVPLANGIAVFSTSTLPAGIHLVGARYLGNATLSPSTAPFTLQTVYAGAPPALSTTALIAAPNPSVPGQAVTFTATVTGASSGTVVFFADGLVLGAAPVTIVGGAFVASMTTATLPVGVHVVTSSFVGGTGVAVSNSLPSVQVVQPPL